jgi:hypothetical protein
LLVYPLLASLALGPRAWAGGGDSRDLARAHYARGLELAGQRGYEGALREFNAAYEISPEYAVLFNIGQAYIALDRPREAIDALARYLRDGQERVPHPRRVQVTAQIARLEARLAALAAEEAAAAAVAAARAGVTASPVNTRADGTLIVRCPDPNIKLALDGDDLDPKRAAQGVVVLAGSHRFSFALPGRRTTEQVLDVPGGATTIVICPTLAPAAAPEAPRLGVGLARPRGPLDGPPVFGVGPTAAAPVELRSAALGYGLAALGVVLGGAAGGVMWWNRGQSQRSDEGLAAYKRMPDDYDRAVEQNQLADSIRFGNQLTIGLALAAVVSLAGGAYLWYRYRSNAGRTE